MLLGVVAPQRPSHPGCTPVLAQLAVWAPANQAGGARAGRRCPSLVPGMVPGAARAPDRAAAVLLPQAIEARSQDEGPEPEAGQQVRGWDAPSAEPSAELGCPALPVSAVGTDPGANGSRRSRPQARAVLGGQEEPHAGGTCPCMPGSPIPHERRSFSRPAVPQAEQPPSRTPGSSPGAGVGVCSTDLQWAGSPCCTPPGTGRLRSGAVSPSGWGGRAVEMGCFLQKAEVGKLERPHAPPFPAGWAGTGTGALARQCRALV